MTTVKRGLDLTVKSVTYWRQDQPSHRVATVSHGSCRPESRMSVGRRAGESRLRGIATELERLGDVGDGHLIAIGQVGHRPSDAQQPIEASRAERQSLARLDGERVRLRSHAAGRRTKRLD